MTPLHHNLLAASVCVAMATLLWRDIESIGRLAVVMLVGVPATVGWMIVVGLFTYSPAMAFDFPPQAYSVDASMAAGVQHWRADRRSRPVPAPSSSRSSSLPRSTWR
jgi:hypothetical protein